MKRQSLAIILMLIVILGCGDPQQAATDQPEKASGSTSETTSGTTSGTTTTVTGTTTQAPTSRGKTLIFDSDRTGNLEVFSMDIATKKTTQLTTDTKYDSFFARISPDGKQIVFVRTPKGVRDGDYTKASIWLMNPDGTNLRQIREKGQEGWILQGHPEWSPDSKNIALPGGKDSVQIYIIDTDGRVVKQVTNRPGLNLDPSYHPSGKSLVFGGCPSKDCTPDKYEVYTINIDGTGEKRLTNDDQAAYDPYYSIDGSKIAWLQNTDPKSFGGIGEWNILLMNADGSNQHSLTNEKGNINSRPEWDATGEIIYFHKMDITGGRNKFDLYYIKPDGTGLTELVPNAPGSNEYPSISRN